MSSSQEIEYSTARSVDVAAFKDILERSELALRRPVGEPGRLARMLNAYNLVVTAWQGERLVGIATLWTDGAFVAYLADLAVTKEMQRSGIGRRLVGIAKETVGPEVTLLLLSAPQAVDYYPRIGMERFSDCFLLKRSR